MKLFFLFLFLSSITFAQQPIDYEISFPNAVHHEAEVKVKFPELPQRTLEVRMSRSSPGRYAVHEFAKNVYNVKAFDGKGHSLSIMRPNPYQWDIAGHDGTVVITYTLYGDRPDGTYAGIDETHARLNIPATFMWARGLDDRPRTITFKPREGWKIATQMYPTDRPTTFTAPNLQYFMDCPTELSNFSLREWKVSSNDTSYTIRLAVHHAGAESEIDTFTEMVKAVVSEEKAFFGELPGYDAGTYTFILDYVPYAVGDGMEHRNSTFISSARPLKTSALDKIGVLSHEYFHSWNVKRIRPKSLQPFNFEEANMSGELWFAEGFTNYYGELALVRAGIFNLDKYAKGIANALNSVLPLPGRMYFSPVEMSEYAPFVDAARSVDDLNTSNTFISYYSYGEIIAHGLDLTLRTRFPGLTLDDYMRVVWRTHKDVDRPYTNEDLRMILGTVTHNPQFADSFFNRYIYGRELVDYGTLLSNAGLLLRKSKEHKASLGGTSLRFEDGNAVVAGAAIVNSPLYNAGLDRTDRIQTIDGVSVGSAKDIDSLLAKHRPGDRVPIEFEQRGMKKSASVTFDENRELEVVPYEVASLPLTDAITKFREQWLGSHAKNPPPHLAKSCPGCNRRYPFTDNFCPVDGDTLQIFGGK